MHSKEILLVVQSELMFSYIIQYYDLLKGDERLNIYFVFSDKTQISEERIQFLETDYKFKIMPSRIAAQSHWDLIIYADHGYFYPLNRNLKKIFCGHGPIIGADSGAVNRNIWDFDYNNTLHENEELVYEKIFVNSDYAKQIGLKNYSKLGNSIVNVGSLMFDEFQKVLKDYEYTKKNPKMNIMVVSTWGNNSLIQFQGKALIKQIRQLHKKFNFILAIHPRNFLEECQGEIDWKKELDELDQLDGVERVKCPMDLMHRLAESDLLLADHTSLSCYFLAADRPAIHLTIPTVKLNKANLVHEVRERAYTIDDLLNLEAKIEDAMKTYKTGSFNNVLNKIVNHLGKASENIKREIYSLLNISAPHQS